MRSPKNDFDSCVRSFVFTKVRPFVLILKYSCFTHELQMPEVRLFLREGPCSYGASLAVCGSGVPPYDFKICMVFSTAGFLPVFLEKRLDLKSLKGWTKAEELGDPVGKRRNRGCTARARTTS
jgi:hypothetical protein